MMGWYENLVRTTDTVRESYSMLTKIFKGHIKFSGLPVRPGTPTCQILTRGSCAEYKTMLNIRAYRE